MDISAINFLDYLPVYMIIGVIASYCFSMMLKMSAIPDKHIPWVSFIACITIATALTIVNTETVVTMKEWVYGVVYGMCIWGIAIGINQTKKQLLDKTE